MKKCQEVPLTAAVVLASVDAFGGGPCRLGPLATSSHLPHFAAPAPAPAPMPTGACGPPPNFYRKHRSSSRSSRLFYKEDDSLCDDDLIPGLMPHPPTVPPPEHLLQQQVEVIGGSVYRFDDPGMDEQSLDGSDNKFEFKFPEMKFPEMKLPEFKFPDMTLPEIKLPVFDGGRLKDRMSEAGTNFLDDLLSPILGSEIERNVTLGVVQGAAATASSLSILAGSSVHFAAGAGIAAAYVAITPGSSGTAVRAIGSATSSAAKALVKLYYELEAISRVISGSAKELVQLYHEMEHIFRQISLVIERVMANFMGISRSSNDSKAPLKQLPYRP